MIDSAQLKKIANSYVIIKASILKQLKNITQQQRMPNNVNNSAPQPKFQTFFVKIIMSTMHLRRSEHHHLQENMQSFTPYLDRKVDKGPFYTSLTNVFDKPEYSSI